MRLIPSYFPTIAYIAAFQSEKIYFSIHSHYQKQTYRNRSYIMGANGKLALTVPIEHSGTSQGHQLDKNVKIKWDEPWQKQHWKSLEAAYRSSPYFEYYEDELRPFFFKKTTYLVDLNLQLIELIHQWLEWPKNWTKDQQYNPLNQQETTLINAKLTPPKNFPQYSQVFAAAHGFIPNLSIIDLIFNMGPESEVILKKAINLFPSD